MPKSGSRSPQDAIARVVAAIPPGRVASYGELARRAGVPGRARLVGHVLGAMSDALNLPWHRVVRADGHLAFAPGSANFREQVRRLSGEGVLVRGGRVDLSAAGWERDLDAALWGPVDARHARARRRKPASTVPER